MGDMNSGQYLKSQKIAANERKLTGVCKDRRTTECAFEDSDRSKDKAGANFH